MREHLTAAENATHRRIDRLHIKCPGHSLRHWANFRELHEARGRMTGGVPMPISYAEIASWSGLLGLRVTAYDVRIIRAIDNEFMAKAYGGKSSG